MSTASMFKRLIPRKYINNVPLMNIMTKRNNSIRCMTTFNRNTDSLLRQSLPFNRIQSFNCSLSTTQNEEIKDEIDSNNFTSEEIKSIEKAASTVPQDGEPRLLLSWICANCGTRNTKTCRKRSYYETLVIMRCDNKECNKWQLMSDHLHWFKDDAFEIEQLLQQNDENPDPDFKKRIMDIINNVNQRNADNIDESSK